MVQVGLLRASRKSDASPPGRSRRSPMRGGSFLAWQTGNCLRTHSVKLEAVHFLLAYLTYSLYRSCARSSVYGFPKSPGYECIGCAEPVCLYTGFFSDYY